MAAYGSALRAQKLQQAGQAFESGRWQEADRLCHSLLREPEPSGALRLAARLALARGAFAEALGFLRRINDVASDEAWVFLALGTALDMTGDPAAAVVQYRRAIEAGGDSPQAQAFLAGALRKSGRAAEAMGLLHRQLNRHPDAVVLWLGFGDALAAQGYLDQARDAYEHPLLRELPATPTELYELHGKLADLAQRANQPARAQAHRQEAAHAEALMRARRNG